jgi:putative redox protein
MTHAHLTQTDGMKTTIRIRDHVLTADEPILDGGTDLGASPTELLIAALASCAAITAKMYAQRKGWALESVEIDVTMERFKAADYPSYTGEADRVNEFRQRMTFKGDLTDEQRQRLLEIAGKCPVHKILTQPNFMFEELE